MPSEFVVFQIFSNEGTCGAVVVSADECVDPVLA